MVSPPAEISADRAAALRRAAAGVAVASLAARLPFVAHRLWDHDSIQFALGVEHFDLAAHQPHPPGYPLYIAILKVLAGLSVPPLAGMVALSLLAAALGGAAMVLLVGRLAGRERALAAGLFAGALYATDPLLWFYGELPLVYAVEGGLAVIVAYAVLRMEEGGRAFLLAAAALAAAGGLRPSTLLLLAPLFLYGVVRTFRRGRLTVRLFLAGTAVGGALVAAWLVPLLVASGGLGAYRRVSAAHFGALLPQTSILYGAGGAALLHNLTLLAKWALQGILPGGAVLAALAALAPGAVLGRGLRLLAGRGALLAAWAVPPILFFALFHITKAGYTLVHLPALLAAVALLAAPALAQRRARALAATAAAALLGAALFLFGRERPAKAPRWRAVIESGLDRGEIRGYEADLDRMRAAVERFPPSSTVLVAVELAGSGAAGSQGFLYPWQRHLQWFLPRYEVLYLAPEAGLAEISTGGHRRFEPVAGADVRLPPSTARLVFVLAGPTGERLRLPPASAVERDGHFLVLVAPFVDGLELGPFRLHRRAGPAPPQSLTGRRTSSAPRAGPPAPGRSCSGVRNLAPTPS